MEDIKIGQIINMYGMYTFIIYNSKHTFDFMSYLTNYLHKNNKLKQIDIWFVLFVGKNNGVYNRIYKKCSQKELW